jgi:hypothetical protein
VNQSTLCTDMVRSQWLFTSTVLHMELITGFCAGCHKGTDGGEGACCDNVMKLTIISWVGVCLTATKIPFMYSFSGNSVASAPISTFMCL